MTARPLAAAAVALAIAAAGLAAGARAAARAAEPPRRCRCTWASGCALVPPGRSEWFAPDDPTIPRWLPLGK